MRISKSAYRTLSIPSGVKNDSSKDKSTSAGTSRQLLRRGAMSGVGGEPDSITDSLDQTFLG
jgi:hypothetical protein